MQTIEMPERPVPAKGPGFDNMDWYLANLDRLVEEYRGQYLAIHNCRVVAASESSADLASQVKALGLRRVLLASAHPEAMQSYKW